MQAFSHAILNTFMTKRISQLVIFQETSYGKVLRVLRNGIKNKSGRFLPSPSREPRFVYSDRQRGATTKPCLPPPKVLPLFLYLGGERTRKSVRWCSLSDMERMAQHRPTDAIQIKRGSSESAKKTCLSCARFRYRRKRTRKNTCCCYCWA